MRPDREASDFKTGAEADALDREREIDPEVDEYFRKERDLRGER